MSVRTPPTTIKPVASADVTAAPSVEGAPKPTHRKVAAHISATLADLIRNPDAAKWQLSKEQNENIFQNRQFTDLSGNTAPHGDLTSTVIHGVDATSVSSSFPIQLGVKITGVDNSTYSSKGESYGMVIPSKASSEIPKELQKDDVSMAMSFANAFPGYNANNLWTHNVTAVPSRNLYFVDRSHPIVTAIQENSESIQAANISETPDNLVKISDKLMDAMMPMVKDQVKNSIKTADLTNFNVSVAPADFKDWKHVAKYLTEQATAPINAKMARDLAGVTDEAQIKAIKEKAAARIEDAQQAVAMTPLSLGLQLDVGYNFL